MKSKIEHPVISPWFWSKSVQLVSLRRAGGVPHQNTTGWRHVESPEGTGCKCLSDLIFS
jgi:hypothetical protein